MKLKELLKWSMDALTALNKSRALSSWTKYGEIEEEEGEWGGRGRAALAYLMGRGNLASGPFRGIISPLLSSLCGLGAAFLLLNPFWGFSVCTPSRPGQLDISRVERPCQKIVSVH